MIIKAAFFLICVLILGAGISLLFKYKMEISMFIGISIISILMNLASNLNIVSIVTYFIYCCIAVLFLFLIIYLIKNFSEIKNIIPKIITPSVVVILLTYFAYMVIIRDKVFVYRDEATSWGYLVRYIDALKKVPFDGFSTRHSMGYFSLFMVSICSYSEPIMYLSRWLFVWIVIVVPMADIGWKKWSKVLIYALGAYCIISIINPAPVYYLDMPLGVVAGIICARSSINKIDKKDYVWIFFGMFILLNIKDDLSMVLGVLVLAYITACNIIRYFSNNEGDKIFDRANVLLNLGLIQMSAIIVLTNRNYITDKLSNTASIVMAILVFILLMVAYFTIKIIIEKELKISKNVKKAIILGVAVLGIFTVYKIIGGIFSSLDFKMQVAFTELLRKLSTKGYFGKTVSMLLGFFVIFITLICLYLVKNPFRKVLAVQSVLIIFMIIVYAAALWLGIIVSVDYYQQWLGSFHRYYGIVFIMAALWLHSRMLDSDIEFKGIKTGIALGLVLMLLFVKEFPSVGFVQYDNYTTFRTSITYGVRNDLRKEAEWVKQKVNTGKVFVVVQDTEGKYDPFSVFAWICYDLLPVEATGTIIEEEHNFYDGIASSVYESDSLKKYLDDEGYTYVYLESIDEYFIDEFGPMINEYGIEGGKLYKITTEGNNYLTLVDSYEK